jgi:hypothetical protein
MLPRCVVDEDEVWRESPGRRVTVIYVLGGEWTIVQIQLV